LEREKASWNVPKIAETIERLVLEDLEVNYFSNNMEGSKPGVEARRNELRTTGHSDGPKNQGRKRWCP